MVPDERELTEAARLIRAGRLVAFPTETVYGLGANALDAAAVQRIYEAKCRPSTSPLIVHVPSPQAAREIVVGWPALADTLTRKFWPGPLTLVLRKANSIPGNVTAGLDTVGVRMPAHPVALALLRRAEVPIAAPRFVNRDALARAAREALCAEHAAIYLEARPSATERARVRSANAGRPGFLRAKPLRGLAPGRYRRLGLDCAH